MSFHPQFTFPQMPFLCCPSTTLAKAEHLSDRNTPPYFTHSKRKRNKNTQTLSHTSS